MTSPSSAISPGARATGSESTPKMKRTSEAALPDAWSSAPQLMPSVAASMIEGPPVDHTAVIGLRPPVADRLRETPSQGAKPPRFGAPHGRNRAASGPGGLTQLGDEVGPWGALAPDTLPPLKLPPSLGKADPSNATELRVPDWPAVPARARAGLGA